MFEKNIGIIGLGFVGLPLSVAISNSKANFNVIGFEKDNLFGRNICKDINNKIIPIKSSDKTLEKNFINSIKKNKFKVTTDLKYIRDCSIIIVSIGFDFYSKESLKNILQLFRKVSSIIKKKSLLVVETTLPPGFSENRIIPILNKKKKKNYVFSFERVMPGKNYYSSIINTTRVYSATNEYSKNKFKNFFSKVINVKKFPLSEISSISTCELTKVLENSYRAMNIAFIDEWVKFSMKSKINLNEAISEIKKRSTHSNIMRPGLGVGGYCLTKDPYFAKYSSQFFFDKHIKFPFVDLTMKTNKNMTKTSLEFIEKKFKNVRKLKLLLLGMSYKDEVKDLRNSPTLLLNKQLIEKNYITDMYDPYFSNESISTVLKRRKYNGIIFCVPHKKFQDLKINFFKKKIIYFDLNMVISSKKLNRLKKNKIKIYQLGS